MFTRDEIEAAVIEYAEARRELLAAATAYLAHERRVAAEHRDEFLTEQQLKRLCVDTAPELYDAADAAQVRAEVAILRADCMATAAGGR